MSEVLAELFSSRVRAVVLAHLLPRPHLGFSLTDLSRRLELPISSLQHECYKLTRLGVLRDRREGASRLYQPDQAWPLLPSLTSFVGGALEPQTILSAVVDGVPGLAEAMIAGQVTGTPAAGRGYLILVGDLSIEDVDAIFGRVVTLLASRVDPARLELAFFRPDDWQTRMANSTDFWVDVLTERVARVAPAAADADG